jgi:uncharacterized protein YqeY
MKERLQGDLKISMKSGDTIRTMTIRGVLAEVTRLEKELRRPANETEVLQVIKRERSQRDEALSFARQGGRADLVSQYEKEAEVLDGYMPAKLDPTELKAAISAEVEKGELQLGSIMKALKARFGARLDGKTASEMVKQALGQG